MNIADIKLQEVEAKFVLRISAKDILQDQALEQILIFS
jgi:hypothetical protein